MKRIACTLLLTFLVGASVLVPAQKSAQAQQNLSEPAVVISIAGVSQQLADLDYLVDASGFGQMKFIAQTLVKQYTRGVDPQHPAGVLLYFPKNSETPDFLGFVPVKNIDDILDNIAQAAEVDEVDGVITVTTDDGTKILIKEVGDHAFIANKKEMFEKLPANPRELLGELPTKYNLAAKVFGQRVPQSLRDQAVKLIRQGYDMQLKQMEEAGDDESAEEKAAAELQKKNFELQMQQMELLLNDTENLTLGMAADKKAHKLYTDFDFQAVPGSNLADRMAAYQTNEPSKFKGFLMNGAAFSANGIMGVSQAEIEQYQQLLGQLEDAVRQSIAKDGDLSEKDTATAQQAVTSLMEVVNETVAEGKFDMGAVLMLKDDKANFAAGTRIADPKKLENALKELLEKNRDKIGSEIDIELNAGSFQDVTYHRITVPVPDAEARKVLGDKVTLIVGIGKKAAYFAAGTNPLALLNQAISGKDIEKGEVLAEAKPLLMQYNISLIPILKFAARVEPNPIIEKMATELQANGRDQIRVLSHTIENGVTSRVEMQDGILSLIKVAFDVMNSGGGIPRGQNDF